MTRLARRIQGMAGNYPAAQAGYHPAAPPDTPMEMPVAMVTYHPAPGYPWGTIRHQTAAQLWSADGAAIPAITGGPFGDVRAAGRP